MTSRGPGSVEAEREEAGTFLRWLRDNHFTFLGYRAYDFPLIDGARIVRLEPDSGLGLLRDCATLVFDDLRDGAPVPPAVADFLERDELLSVTKSHRQSTVHRPVLMDAIVVKRFDDDGQAVRRAPLHRPVLGRRLQPQRPQHPAAAAAS